MLQGPVRRSHLEGLGFGSIQPQMMAAPRPSPKARGVKRANRSSGSARGMLAGSDLGTVGRHPGVGGLRGVGREYGTGLGRGCVGLPGRG